MPTLTLLYGSLLVNRAYSVYQPSKTVIVQYGFLAENTFLLANFIVCEIAYPRCVHYGSQHNSYDYGSCDYDYASNNVIKSQ